MPTGGNDIFDLSKEYSDKVDELRKNRVKMSFYKYGSAAANFGRGYVNALETMQMCVDKYKETQNKEYLLDAMNYLMFEFMYPQLPDVYFRATDSGESAGIAGISIKEMEGYKNGKR